VSRRPSILLLQVLVLMLGALLGIATNFATDTSSVYMRIMRHWSLPLIGGTVVLMAVVQWSLYRIEHMPLVTQWSPGRSPYPGLESFSEQDAGVFFGRRSDIERLYSRLHPALPAHATRWVTLVGPSGVGKSSLVCAGLLPRLVQRGRWTVLPVMTPDEEPIVSLARSLGAVLAGRPRQAIAQRLGRDPLALAELVDEVRATRGGRPGDVLLVVDQAEQLVTLPDRAKSLAFLELLDLAVREDSKLWVLLALRSEFLTTFLATPFAHMFSGSVNLGVLGRRALFEIIEGPAERDGVTFDPPGLVNTIADETAGGDALPLLAYTLRELYLAAGPSRRITAHGYRHLGGVAGTLRRQADKAAEEVIARLADAPVINTLLKFVTVTDLGPTRRPVRGGALSPAERHVVDAFVSARLLTSDNGGDEGLYQVAHEALFRQWAPLRQAIDERTEALRWRADLERWAEDWQRSGRHDTYLLRGTRLSSALRWSDLGAAEGTDSLLVTALLDRSRRADQAAMQRLADACSERALAHIERDPEYSLLLACTALEECMETAQARRVLATALAAARVRAVFEGHTDEIWCVAVSCDGSRIATGSQDLTVRIVDIARRVPDLVLRGHDGWVRKVAWSPDDRWVATASEDNTARVWRSDDGSERRAFNGHDDWVRSVAWSADGRQLATASNDMTVRIWDVATGQEKLVLSAHRGPVWDVAWSPDSRHLATASQDRTVRIWDAANGAEHRMMRGHDDWVRAVVWSPDGGQLATASNDRTARIWQVAEGTERYVLRGHDDWVRAVAWSPEGGQLATASNDRTVRIWDAANGQPVLLLNGHNDAVASVAWLPDGGRVATASRDRTARIWDIRHRVEFRVLRGHLDAISHVAWSPDGRLLATGSHDRTALIWDVIGGSAPLACRSHDGAVRSVAWSPAGQQLATASSDRTVRLWRTHDATELRVIRGHTDAIGQVAWSPDGRWLATASQDRTVRIWDPETGEGRVLARHDDAIWSVSWSPNSRYVATAASDRTARVWSVDNGAQVRELRGHEDTVWSVAWSPDGSRLATVSHDRTIRLWPVGSETNPAVLLGHEDTVWSVAWSPDGQHLATVSQDRTVRLWSAHSGDELVVLGVHDGQAEAVAWSPDGRHVATAARDRTVRVWAATTDLATQIAQARRYIFRELTPEERHSLGLAG
jgi:WD40 repeat protein